MHQKQIFMVLLITLMHYALCSSSDFDRLCQSGLREDNTNYVYCSRQDLPRIPSFFSDNTSGSTSIGVSNVFYDELVLTDNLIEQIEQNSFGKMLKVRKLYLDQNPIRYIHDRAFEHIRNYLEDLHFEQKVLDNNYASADDSLIFENSIFQMCFNLHLLSIKAYHMTRLKPFQFLRMSKLQTLIMTNNQIMEISDDAFKGLEKSLTYLNLDSNYLENVPSSSIQNLKNLRTLSLSQNRIKSLEANQFMSLYSLRTLDMSYNIVSGIDRNAFNGPIQRSLRSLLVQNNELKWENLINLLTSLNSLHELNMDFNKLAKPIRKTFHYDLDRTSLVSTLVKLSLTSLSLQGNRLSESDLKMLIEPIENEDFNRFKFSFRMTEQKRYKTNVLKYKRFSYPNLVNFNLARNKIKHLPMNFFHNANMSALETLTLDRNPLESTRITPNYFSGLENSLTLLSLNNAGFNLWSPNSIEAFLRLEKLQSLKLNGNTQQEESLSVNTLKSDKPKIKMRLQSLTSLELQNNNLKQLPDFICQLKNLENLDLSSNLLASVDLTCFKDQDNGEKIKLNQLNLNKNPLNCDCKLRDLKMWLMSTYDKDLLDLIMWECSNLNGRHLVNVDLYEMICEVPTTSINLLKLSTTSTVLTTTTQQQITQSSLFTEPPVYIANTEPVVIIPIKANIKTSTKALPQATSTQILSQKASQIIDEKPIDLSYYSLIIGISLGISAICLVILVFFYLNCARRVDSSNLVKKSPYISQSNTKYDAKLQCCSPNSSTASSTATTSTLATGNHNLMITSSEDSFSRDSLITHSNNELLLKHNNNCLHDNDFPHYYHNFYDQVNTQQYPCKAFTVNQNSNFQNRKLGNSELKQQNIFSITTGSRRQVFEPAQQADPHIYHEINTPVKFTPSYPQRASVLVSVNQHGELFADQKLFMNPVNGFKPLVANEGRPKQYLVNSLDNGLIV